MSDMALYERGRGIFVGTFNEEQVMAGADNIAVAAMKEKTGLRFTNAKNTKNGLMLWVCDAEDFKV